MNHIERVRRMSNFDGLPNVKYSTVKDFFKEAKQDAKNLMTWEGELYLELHNGTYTSMAANKHYNRRMETMLRDTEIISSLAAMVCGPKFTYKYD